MELLGKQNVIQSNSIVTAAEQVRPGPVLGTPPVTKLMSHRLADCSTSLHQQQEKHDLQLFDRWQVRTSSRCVEADLSLRRCSMSATREWRRQVWWCRAVECTVCQHRHLECNCSGTQNQWRLMPHQWCGRNVSGWKLALLRHFGLTGDAGYAVSYTHLTLPTKRIV